MTGGTSGDGQCPVQPQPCPGSDCAKGLLLGAAEWNLAEADFGGQRGGRDEKQNGDCGLG